MTPSLKKNNNKKYDIPKLLKLEKHIKNFQQPSKYLLN